MTITMQSLLDLARIDLNDADKTRWSDSDLLKHANDALLQARGLRPDLFLGTYSTSPTDKMPDDNFPLPLAYRRAVADYIIARASAVDNDLGDDARAAAYMATFLKAMS